MPIPVTVAFFSSTNPPADPDCENTEPRSAPDGPGDDFSFQSPRAWGTLAPQSANYGPQQSDSGKILPLASSGAHTVTLPTGGSSPLLPAVFGSPLVQRLKWQILIQNNGPAAWTIAGGGLDIDGSPTALTLQAGQGVLIRVSEDGLSWQSFRGGPASSSIAGGPTSVTQLSVTSSAAGPFQVSHGLGAAPSLVLLEQTSGGEIWFQLARYDASFLYLDASADGVSCIAVIFVGGSFSQVVLNPAAAGLFQVPHSLGATPALVEIQMTQPGEIWFQSTPYDSVNINLDASAPGLTGYAIVWAALPAPVLKANASIALTPSVAGPFKVAHGLPVSPSLILLQMRSEGEIWLQSPASDDTYIYLVASADGIVGQAQLWAGGGITSAAPTTEVAFTSSAGDFTIAHALGYSPTSASILMTSPGAVWFQAALRWDATNIYLSGAAAGLTGFVEVWK